MTQTAIPQRRRLDSWLWWLCFVGGLLAVWPLQLKIERSLALQSQGTETLYITSGKALRRLTLGYAGLFADIYWTRAVQYFGRRRLAHEMSYPLLGPLLRVTTDLDPHLLIAYRFGAVFLAEKPPGGAGKPEEALELIRRGIVKNPDYWRFWQDLGFIYYWDVKDYPMAARAFEVGSQQPGAYMWMKAMAATVAAQGGELATSRLLWSEIYRTAGTDTVRKSALAHLAALQAEAELSQLNALVDRFTKAHGHPPTAIQALLNTGYLHTIPVDPSGVPYTLGPGGRVTLAPRSKVDMGLLQ